MSYRTDLASGVRTEIRALPGYVRAQALKLIAKLAVEPRPPRSTLLRGKENVYRILLAGRWRMAYAVDDEEECVLVLRVRSKERIDYESLPS